MLTIRFSRIGKRNQPSFKIVVTDKRNSSTRGRFVEQVGTMNPRTKEKTLKADRIKYWLSVGAKPSPSVHNLFVSEKIIEGKKIDVHNKPKAKEGKPAEGTVAEPTVKEAKPEEKPAEVPAPEKPVEAAPQPAAEPQKEVVETVPQQAEEPKKEEPPKA